MATVKNSLGKHHPPKGLVNALSNPFILFFIGLCLGFSTGLLISNAQNNIISGNEGFAEASFYVCTYSISQPESIGLGGVYCRFTDRFNASSGCFNALNESFIGSGVVPKKEIERVNKEYNQRMLR